MPRRHLKNCQLGIFDWNGTLVDDLPLVLESVARIFKHFKTPIPHDLATKYREQITANFSKFYHHHGIPSHITAEEMNAQRVKFFKKYRSCTRLRAHAKQVLTFCKALGSVQIGIVSAEVNELLRKGLRDLEIEEYFDFVWADTRDKTAALEDACDAFEVHPSRTFYVDDTCEGVRASAATGVIPVALVTPTSYAPEALLREEARAKKAIIITDLAQIKQLI
ncbi:MAG: HAD family phosphatase [bacterium]|nr:HAD family phosphatase [bacterium]